MKFQTLLSLIFVGFMVFTSSCSDSDLNPVEPEKEEEEMEDPDDGNNTGNDNLVDAPAFSIKTWEGDDLKSETYAEKVLVIWFFGSDCPPCKSIGPSVEEKLNKDFRGKGDYAIIGIDQWDRNDATVEGFMKITGIEFPLGAMGSGVAKDYDTTYDRLVVINKEGKIAYKADSRATNNIDDVVDLVKDLID